jgi:glycosyltransferase involved in cell wall biosynthesis
MLFKKRFIFSVIVPIYNTERYLRDSLDSIIGQSIGFRKNIQLILVDDGSSDGSRQICLEYQKKFPKNIWYQYQENKGVAGACNTGLRFAQGKYTNFFSSDDVWDCNAFQSAHVFFEKHYEQIDLLACRMRYFEAEEGFLHPLDWKYTDDYVVDLMRDYDKVVLSGGNCIFKTETLQKYRFSENLRTYEDALLIGKILLEKNKYGILKSAVYHYRRRWDQSSLINTDKQKKPRFLDMPRHFLEEYLDTCIKRRNEVLDYVQYTVMYVLQWHMKGNGLEILNEDERQRYAAMIAGLLKRIDDRIIYKQKSINLAMKHYIFKLKHGMNVCDEGVLRNGMLYHNGTRVFNLKSLGRLTVDTVEASPRNLHIEGTTDLYLLGDSFEVGVLLKNDKYIPLRINEQVGNKQKTFQGEEITVKRRFAVDVPRTDATGYRFVARKKKDAQIELVPQFNLMEN